MRKSLLSGFICNAGHRGGVCGMPQCRHQDARDHAAEDSEVAHVILRYDSSGKDFEQVCGLYIALN